MPSSDGESNWLLHQENLAIIGGKIKFGELKTFGKFIFEFLMKEHMTKR